MDDFNNKFENENKNTETPVNETPAEPQAQQPNETAPQQTETPQAQQKSGEEPRTPFQTPVQHPEYQSPRERSNAQQFQSSQQPPVQQTPQQQNGIPYSDAWHQQNQQNAMPHRSKKSGRRLVIGLCSVAAACLLFAGGAVAVFFGALKPLRTDREYRKSLFQADFFTNRRHVVPDDPNNAG